MNWTIRAEVQPLTKEEMHTKEMNEEFSWFSDDSSIKDFKCKNCKYRVLLDKGDIADCTKVQGGVSLNKGVCRKHSPGNASSKEDVATMRMTYEQAQYEESTKETVCKTCDFYEPIDGKDGNCLLWMRKTEGLYCCDEHTNKYATIPSSTHLKENT